MNYNGIAKGKTIELEELLPYPEGQPVRVQVEPLATRSKAGTPAAVQDAMHEPPHLTWVDVDDLEGAIEQGRLPIRQGNVFKE